MSWELINGTDHFEMESLDSSLRILPWMRRTQCVRSVTKER